MAKPEDLIAVYLVTGFFSASSVQKKPRFPQGGYVLRNRGLRQGDRLPDHPTRSLSALLEVFNNRNASWVSQRPGKTSQASVLLSEQFYF